MKNQSGFTIIELLVGMTVTAIILTAVAMLMGVVLPGWQRNSAKIEIEQTLRIGIDAVVREARYARVVKVPPESGGYSLDLILANTNKSVKFKLNETTRVLAQENENKGEFQPVAGDGTGGVPGNTIIVDNPSGEPMFCIDAHNDKLLVITLTARDKNTGVQLTMRTKIFCMNKEAG